MILVRYNKETLNIEEVKYWKVFVCFFGIILLFLLSSFIAPKDYKTKYIKTETEVNVITNNSFSEENLIEEIKRVKIKNAHIFYAQILIESKHFKSPKFKKFNNLCGMRVAGSRPSTRSGEDDFGFATYRNWKDCVLDYALLQSGFARDLKENEYY